MNWYQMGLWKEEVQKGYRLNQHLLAEGEKPDTRPWGGRFDKPFKFKLEIEGPDDSHEGVQTYYKR